MRRSDLCHAIRQSLKRLPPPHQAHYGVVPPPPPASGISVLPVQARHQAATRALARVQTLAEELRDPYIVSRVLPRREAVSSSAVEGTHSTLDELLIAEETSDAATRPSAATRQVRDYAAVLEALLPRAREAGPCIFTRGLIADLHRHVMRDDTAYPDVPGELRRLVVWIGGGDIAYSTYTPPPPDDVAACLDATIAYLRGDEGQLLQQSQVTRMAVAHTHFEAVHPFRDGNGRVGRLLLPLIMAADGDVPLYLSPYIEAHRASYHEALRAAQQQLAWHEVIGFVADAIVGTVDELMATRQALSALRALWLARQGFRAGSAARRAVDLVPHYPVLTVGRLAALLDLTFRAAGLGVKQLVAAGILVERTGFARNRVFSAPEVLGIINRPYGAEPVLPPR